MAMTPISRSSAAPAAFARPVRGPVDCRGRGVLRVAIEEAALRRGTESLRLRLMLAFTVCACFVPGNWHLARRSVDRVRLLSVHVHRSARPAPPGVALHPVRRGAESVD